MISERLGSRVRGRLFASIFTICVLACGISSSPSRAQDEAGSSEYRGLIDQALNEFGHKNWPEARVLFRRAHELSPNARTLRGMGMTSYEMRDYVNAVVQLSGALEEKRQPLTDSQRKEVEQLLARSRTFVGAYTLSVEPAEAVVTLDGASPTRDGTGRILVPFGEHTVHASAPGYEDQNTKLSVQGAEQSELKIALRKPVVATVAARPEPPSNPFGKASTVLPVYEKTGGFKYSYVALGATVAFGAAAVGTWFAGQGKLNDLDDQCAERAGGATPCVRGGVDTGSVKTLERTTNALLGLTGAALVATVVVASFEWPRERRTLAMDVGPNRLSLRGSF